MSALISTITTLSRARHLREPVTLAASGIRLQQISTPFIFIGVLLSLLTFTSFEWLQPISEAYKRDYLSNIGANILESELNKEQSSFKLQDDTLYFFQKESGKAAVVQRRKDGKIESELFAENAEILINRKDKKLELQLDKVTLLNYQNKNPRFIKLYNLKHHFEYPEHFSKQVSLRHIPLSKMYQQLQTGEGNITKLRSYFYEKISLILSPLLLIFAAFPLGFLGRSTNRITGFLLGLMLVFLIYYPLLLIGKKMAQAGQQPAWLLLQLPNIVLLFIGTIGFTSLNRKV